MSQKFEVVSYNILSTELCTPKYYSYTDPKFLKTDYRWELLKAKLTEKINNKAIICLQEVSVTWLSKLTALFSSANYYVVNDNYGNEYNGYMGVLVAVPNNIRILGTEIVRIGTELKKRTRYNKQTMIQSTIKAAKNIVKALPFVGSMIKRDDWDDWNDSTRRYNSLIHVRLVCDGGEFCVGTYHMPCAFKTTTVSASHSSMLIQQMSKLSDGAPFILTGDFNIKANTPVYNVIVNKGEVLNDFTSLIEIPDKYDVKWNATIPMALRSAYLTVKGTEPKFTNNCRVVDKEQFTDTLDYIFYTNSDYLTALSVSDVNTDEKAICPNESEPSDHYLISAVFNLQKM